jgi:hypothetical protein
MNSLPKLIASISALIASLSFAWIALTITGTIPHQSVRIYHGGKVQLTTDPFYDRFDVEISSGAGGFEITHQ